MMTKLPATVSEIRYLVRSPDGYVIPSGGDMAGQIGWTCLGSKEVVYEVPQDEVTPIIIQSLRDQAEGIHAEATAAVRLIMNQIDSLQNLEHLPGGDE